MLAFAGILLWSSCDEISEDDGNRTSYSGYRNDKCRCHIVFTIPCLIHICIKAITNITNGIMRDTRAFAVTDPEWVMKYNNYSAFSFSVIHLLPSKESCLARMEAARTRAWSGEGPELVIEQAQARLLDESWNTVRPAISITIRFVSFALVPNTFRFSQAVRTVAGSCVVFLKLNSREGLT